MFSLVPHHRLHALFSLLLSVFPLSSSISVLLRRPPGIFCTVCQAQTFLLTKLLHVLHPHLLAAALMLHPQTLWLVPLFSSVCTFQANSPAAAMPSCFLCFRTLRAQLLDTIVLCCCPSSLATPSSFCEGFLGPFCVLGPIPVCVSSYLSIVCSHSSCATSASPTCRQSVVPICTMPSFLCVPNGVHTGDFVMTIPSRSCVRVFPTCPQPLQATQSAEREKHTCHALSIHKEGESTEHLVFLRALRWRQQDNFGRGVGKVMEKRGREKGGGRRRRGSGGRWREGRGSLTHVALRCPCLRG